MSDTHYTYKRTVAFHEVDPAGIARFTTLLYYVEEAEMAFMKDHGLTFFSPECAWPRVKVEVDYVSSVGLGDEVEVHICPRHVGRTSMEWGYSILRGDQIVLTGRYITVRMGKNWKKKEIPVKERTILLPWCAGI